MEQVERAGWSEAERDLWGRIEAHDFEPEGHALGFTRRLARDHGWDLGFARAAVDEYRRFCFLALASGRAVTPSEEVDEVWHQHLTVSRDYWDRWCATVLRADLHHDPTRGGTAERNRFAAQYAETLAGYERYFGPPSPTFWPGTAERFRPRPRYRVVDRDSTVVLHLGSGPKRLLRRWAGLLGLSSLLAVLAPTSAAALPVNPLDWTAEPFLTLYALTIVAGVALALGVRRAMRTSDRRPRQDGLGEIDLAYLAGGPTRAADTVILGFMLAGGARLDEGGGGIVFAEQASRLPHHLAPFGRYASGALQRADLIKRMRSGLEAIRDGLIERGLLLSREQAGRSIAAVVFIMGLVAAFGSVKVSVGLSRGKPVGFLVMLVCVAAIAGVVLCIEAVRRTRAGNAALSDYRARHERAARAPRDREIPLAFALAGPTVLVGTAYAAYGDILKASGSGGDGGGSDGGGGGGCGGCGGGD